MEKKYSNLAFMHYLFEIFALFVIPFSTFAVWIYILSFFIQTFALLVFYFSQKFVVNDFI